MVTARGAERGETPFLSQATPAGALRYGRHACRRAAFAHTAQVRALHSLEPMVADEDGIAFEHRRLASFFEELHLALERSDRRECETACFRLQAAVLTHFDVEEQVIFPAIRARRPDVAEELDALEREHQQLRDQLEETCAALSGERPRAPRHALDTFRRALGRHDRSEEELVHRAHQPGSPVPPIAAPPGPGHSAQ